MEFQWLGLQNYEPLYEKQIESKEWSPDREIVFGLEHPFVITLGRRAKLQEEVCVVQGGIPIVHTDRGGLATLHSPGQLVIYPLLSITKRGWGPKDYVCQLLRITKTCLQELGIHCHVDETQSGLFVNESKICFIGLRVSEGRVYHGLSLNVNNDLSLFDQIRSCGLQQRPMTSLNALGVEVSVEDVFTLWKNIAQGSLSESRASASSSRCVQSPLEK